MSNILAFIPSQQNDSCSVHKLYNKKEGYTLKKFLYELKHVLVISHKPTLNGLIAKNSLKRFACIGHKDQIRPMIVTATQDSFIVPEWFDINIAFGIFFVSDGASLFANSNDWKGKFKSWLTFNKLFQANIEMEGFKRLQFNMYLKMQREIKKCPNGAALKSKLEIIYSKTINKLYSEYRNNRISMSDVLFIEMCLVANKTAIIHG